MMSDSDGGDLSDVDDFVDLDMIMRQVQSEQQQEEEAERKKQKSVETTSAGGSTGGSQSESVSSLVSQDYRRKCDAAEKAYEAKRDKELAIMQCKELKFLKIDHSSLPAAKRAIIERKQAE
nr:hypothetical protein [Tanacetum cinerariifolium]